MIFPFKILTQTQKSQQQKKKKKKKRTNISLRNKNGNEAKKNGGERIQIIESELR